jgi:hypothetical protein
MEFRAAQQRRPNILKSSFPMARRPDPAFAGGIFVPMARNPGGIDARAGFPMAGHPDPAITGVHPIAADPRVRGIRGWTFHFGPRCGRRFCHHDGARRARRRHGFVGGHNHGLMMRGASAEDHARHDRQNAKHCFFHNFFGWQEHILGECRVQMGRFATRNRGEMRTSNTTIQHPTSNVRETSSRLRLELFASGVIFDACQFTNFTAKNAVRTARFWFGRAIGRAPSARNAARRNSKRNSPPSPQPTPEAARRLRPNVAAADADRGVGVIKDWLNK